MEVARPGPHDAGTHETDDLTSAKQAKNSTATHCVTAGQNAEQGIIRQFCIVLTLQVICSLKTATMNQVM